MTHLSDILLHPLQGETLIQISNVKISVFLNFFAGKEAKDSNSVVQSNDNNIMVTSLNEISPVHLGTGISVETAALKEDVDRVDF